jgi:hypothetical protein
MVHGPTIQVFRQGKIVNQAMRDINLRKYCFSNEIITKAYCFFLFYFCLCFFFKLHFIFITVYIYAQAGVKKEIAKQYKIIYAIFIVLY